jgi:zinc protease
MTAISVPALAAGALQRSALGLAGVLVALSLFGATPGKAMTIERMVSPGGIEAWVVRDPTLPLIALDFAVRGSADQDPPGKPGVANMASSLLDEGAGPYDSKAFNERLERKAIEMGFRTSHDHLRGTLRTLSENADEAFDYLRLALTEPRFDTEAVERIRAQLMSRLQRETTSPNDLASRNWWATAFPDHPYGRPVGGSLESVPQITVAEMRAYVGHVLARDNLKIAIVGDIDIATAGRLIDRAFGALPPKAQLVTVPDAVPQGLGRRIVVKLDVPQSVVNFGTRGLKRSDPDFMAGYIVNHILAGGSFSSRLYREVREKRGLAYGISGSLVWLERSAMLVGSTATRADATAETIEIIEREIRRLAQDGPTQDELDKAKSYLKGSFALGLDTSNRIAAQLVQMQIDDLGIDYIERRSSLIDAVTLDDTKRLAKRLLDTGLLVTVVGRPEGVSSSEVGASSTEIGKPPEAPAAGNPQRRQ